MNRSSNISIPLASLPDASLRSSISRLVRRKLNIQAKIDALEEIKESILSELLDLQSAHHLSKVQGDGWTSLITSRTTTSLNKLKLIERGTSVEDIDYATEIREGKPYLIIRVVDSKQYDE